MHETILKMQDSSVKICEFFCGCEKKGEPHNCWRSWEDYFVALSLFVGEEEQEEDDSTC